MRTKEYIPALAFLTILCGLVLPATAAHAEFISLSPNLPLINRIGSGGTDSNSMAVMINQFFVIAIAFSAMLAVIYVAIGGFQYMTTDSVFRMGNARERIADAIIGLLIVLMAILVLKTINPCLVTLSILDKNGTTCVNP